MQARMQFGISGADASGMAAAATVLLAVALVACYRRRERLADWIGRRLCGKAEKL
jgi:hypothetical protein